MEMNCTQILEAANGKLLQAGNMETNITRLTIDSRDTAEGAFFIPLAGDRTDGHRFIRDAAQRGAIGCFSAIAADVALPKGLTVIGVPDTLQALQQVAAHYRKLFSLHMIGVTGSVGKTTTKDIIAAVLSQRFKTLATQGNLNNHIGLPLMLSRLDSTYEASVLEMGMSGAGEIDLLARLALPKIGVITNIGESHLEALGSREAIACAKRELLQHLPENGIAFINGDEPLLFDTSKKFRGKLVTFGFSSRCTMRCTNIVQHQDKKAICLEQHGFPSLTLVPPLPGRHNIYNVMAAVAVGRGLGVTDEEIVQGLSLTRLSGMRLEVVTTAGLHVINDTYNASPTSVAAAIDVLDELAGSAGKMAVLGDMLELGSLQTEGHRQVGRLVASKNLDALVVFGERAQEIATGALQAGFPQSRVHKATTHSEAAQTIRQLARPGDWVLIKGSRGMRMEDVLAALSGGVK
ncbi:MAG: UDP-N-acetylmuramoyl-tripeptide--D-alanyl-D-alanine ligase [Clostridiales bacterium]|jgi:UDP-N-acetylmuramoyl-tripeptide--D-alanyl-D-alanine ligase|nr:UDP-N-acetylmuramoyl-tripeptide--D-alanyl-D-alanine ligase [Clostridiales bacterium]